MENVTIISDEYNNIQGIGAKKIKLTGPNLKTLRSERKIVKTNEIVPEEKVDLEPIAPVEEKQEIPSYLYNNEPKNEYRFDEVKIKERVAENYGNFARPEVKETKVEKQEVKEEKPKMTEKDFETLLATNVVIMEDKMDKFRQVFGEKQSKLREAKLEQSKLADSFQKTSNEQQNAKLDADFKKRRTAEMKNAEHFAYLEIGKDEDSRMIEAVRVADEALKNLFNVNQVIYKETIAKIEQCESEKESIDKKSEKVRAEIQNLADDITKFMEHNAPLIEEIIKINEKYKDTEAESEKAIKDEYDALTKERTSRVVFEQKPAVNEAPMENPQNIFESFKRAQVFDGTQSAVNINNPFIAEQENQNMSYGRVA